MSEHELSPPPSTEYERHHGLARRVIDKILRRQVSIEPIETNPLLFDGDDERFDQTIMAELDAEEYVDEPGIAYYTHRAKTILERVEESDLDKAEKDKRLKDLQGILLYGKFGDLTIDANNPDESDYQARRFRDIKRMTFAGIYERNPSTAQKLAEYDIFGFHASSSGTLLGILEHGLLPGVDVRERGLATNGEWVFQSNSGQDSISVGLLGDVVTLANYAGSGKPRSLDEVAQSIKGDEEFLARFKGEGGLVKRSALEARIKEEEALYEKLKRDPEDLNNRLYMENIPILWGISRKLGEKQRFHRRSEETRIDEVVKISDCQLIAVPSEKIDYVQKIVDQAGRTLELVPIEDILAQIWPAKPEGKVPSHEYWYEYGKGLQEKWD